MQEEAAKTCSLGNLTQQFLKASVPESVVTRHHYLQTVIMDWVNSLIIESPTSILQSMIWHLTGDVSLLSLFVSSPMLGKLLSDGLEKLNMRSDTSDLCCLCDLCCYTVLQNYNTLIRRFSIQKKKIHTQLKMTRLATRYPETEFQE